MTHEANLGYATTAELANELQVRIMIGHGEPNYRSAEPPFGARGEAVNARPFDPDSFNAGAESMYDDLAKQNVPEPSETERKHTDKLYDDLFAQMEAVRNKNTQLEFDNIELRNALKNMTDARDTWRDRCQAVTQGGVKLQQHNAARIAELEKRVEHVRDAWKIQGTDGNWNVSGYMRGMFNGLEFAMSVLEGREVAYREESRPESHNASLAYKDGFNAGYEKGVKEKQEEHSQELASACAKQHEASFASGVETGEASKREIIVLGSILRECHVKGVEIHHQGGGKFQLVGATLGISYHSAFNQFVLIGRRVNSVETEMYGANVITSWRKLD